MRTQPTASDDPSAVVWFGISAEALDWRATEVIVAAAEVALALAAPRGLIGLWRWPHGKDSALVVDGDVDHPTGVDPECSRYVAPALETARRAGFPAYGIFAAAANIEAEPSSFPPAGGYYNHSYTHPYSHWNPEPWESLDDEGMERELGRVVLDCSTCGRTVHWVAGLAASPGHWAHREPAPDGAPVI